VVWPGREKEAFDQEWYSETDHRKWTFSGLVYAYVCFDLVLEGWLDRPPAATEAEREYLSQFPRLRSLIDECEAAAQADHNLEVSTRIPQLRSFFELYEDAIRLLIDKESSHPRDPRRSK
jgi:hypothetical protein